jgi:ferredoxin
MPATVKEEECVSCGTCVENCPEEAITMGDNDMPIIDKEKCTECGTCVENCPSEAITVE